jgi:hypothetical protein
MMLNEEVLYKIFKKKYKKGFRFNLLIASFFEFIEQNIFFMYKNSFRYKYVKNSL